MDSSPPPPLHSSSPIAPNSSSSSSSSNSPIVAVAIIGILATAFLLVSYYIFVIKCCLNWHRFDLLRRSTPPIYFPTATPRGLDDSLIRLIPVIRFRKVEKTEHLECAVCLSDFKEGEKLRVIPNCCHAFHIDCIDVWLQSNANCPLCRSSISSNTLSSIDRILTRNNDNNDDFVVIEIRNNNLVTSEERAKKGRGRIHHLSSMDDECIGIRHKDELFNGVQPVRRSISMDLSTHRQLCLEIREVLEQSRVHGKTGVTSSTGDEEESSSNRGLRRSFFSFGSGRGGSRNANFPPQ